MGPILSLNGPSDKPGTIHQLAAVLGTVTAATNPQANEMTWVSIADDDVGGPVISLQMPTDEDIAYLQYTSGSTSSPKGVIVTHANLTATLSYLSKVWVSHGEQSVGVSWLPAFHDMGLVFGVLQPLYSGFPIYLMSPMAFIRKPLRWLKAISAHKATVSAAPNFAFDLCTSSVSLSEVSTLDLSVWAIAGNAAEPIRFATLERFAAHFADAGFRRTAFCGGYGLAEATVAVAAQHWGSGPGIIHVNRDTLERGRIEIVQPSHPQAKALVGCGTCDPVAISEIAIVDHMRQRRCSSLTVGEVWIRGPGIAKGYWQQPEATAAAFCAKLRGSPHRFLRTGDLGFLFEGDLFITGRLKELIIVRGRNLYPHDLEHTVRCIDSLPRRARVVAFGIDEEDKERVVIVRESDTLDSALQAGMRILIERTIVEEYQVMPHVVFVRKGSIPLTSSGKIQRTLSRELYLTGHFGKTSDEHLEVVR